MAGVRIVVSAIDRATAPFRAIREQLSSIGSGVQLARAGMERFNIAAGGMQRVTARVKEVNHEVGRLTGRIKLLSVPLAAGLALGVRDFVETGSEILRTAKRLGVATTALQELQFAGEELGLDPSEFVSGLDEMQKRLGEVQGGKRTGKAAEALKYLGIFDQIQSGALTLEESLDLVTHSLEGVADSDTRARVADALTGNERYIALLGAGLRTVDAYRESAHRLGRVLSSEQLAAAKGAGEELKELKNTLQGLALAVVSEALPAVRQIVRDMTAWAQDRKNRAWIRDELVPALMAVVKIIPGMVGLVTRVVGVRTAFVLLVLTIVGPLIGAIAMLGLSIGVLLLKMALLRGVMAAMGVEVTLTGLVISNLRTVLSALVPVLTLVWAQAVGLVTGGFKLMIVDGLAMARTVIPMMISGLVSMATAAIPALLSGLQALTAAFFATPIGWIVAGVMVLVGLGVLLYKKWQPFREFIDALWMRIKAMAETVRMIAGTIWNQPAAAPSAEQQEERSGYTRPERRFLQDPARISGAQKPVGGRVAVDIALPRGASGSVRSVQPQPGTDLDVGILVAP